MKKKILILCDFFLPSVKAGGPLRAVSALIDCLKEDFDITVVTRNHDLCVSEPYLNIESDKIQKRDRYKILYLSPKKMLRGIYGILLKQHFDIIYFNSFFSPKITIFPLVISILKKSGKRVVISPRGELGDGALSIKGARKKLYIFLFKIFFLKYVELHASSENEKKEIKKIMGSRVNLIALPDIPTKEVSNKIINNKKENELKIVFLSRICKKKNLHYAIDVLASVKGDTTLDIYGLIQEPDYWKMCFQYIKKLPSHVQVKYCGECNPDSVLTTLKNYDLFLLPTLNENYGYVIVESLASGCPVLLSDQTPWHDLSKHNAGWEYPLSQPEKFVEKIDELILMGGEEYSLYKNAALDYYKKNIVNDVLEKKYQEFFIGRRDAIYRVSEGLI